MIQLYVKINLLFFKINNRHLCVEFYHYGNTKQYKNEIQAKYRGLRT